MSTDTNIEIHKYLDHCENEHKEENALGLHGATATVCEQCPLLQMNELFCESKPSVAIEDKI